MKRYPGAQPFSTEQQRVFFGREQELDALRRMVEIEPMVVLFAKSGMGKSSLLNAGLIAEVLKVGRFAPISIRFGAHTEGSKTTPLELAREQLAAGGKQEKNFLEKIKPKNENSLWFHLKNRQLAAQKPNNFLLIFDQFEELFTYPEAEIAAFGRQLSELLFTDIPDRFREKLEAGLEKTPDFLSESELRELHRPLNLRVVMAIRSDRMSLLNKLAPYLPNILENCRELAPLNRQQAESAILSPAYLPQEDGFDSPVFDFEDEAVEKLLDFLSEDGKQEIESFQLQILCEYAERAVVLKQKRLLVSAADFAEPNAILENYYLDKIAELPEEEQLPARKLIEEGLIFEEEERRLSLYEGQILKTYGVSENLLQRLLNTHLIRSEPSLRGGYTYELSHDTLVAPVLKAKAKRLEEERKIAEEKEQLRREQELAELRQKAEEERQRAEKEQHLRLQAERQRRFARRVSALAVILALFAGWQYFAAENAREAAVTNFENLKKTQEAKMKLERQIIIQQAETYEQANEYWLARESWRAALQLDSLASDAAYIREQIERCGKLLGE